MTLAMFLQGGLLAACLGVALYCHVLARRLRRLNDLETGLGGAIAVMTAEISRLEGAIGQAQDKARGALEDLAAEIDRASAEQERLRMLAATGGVGAAPRIRRMRRVRPEKRDPARREHADA